MDRWRSRPVLRPHSNRRCIDMKIATVLAFGITITGLLGCDIQRHLLYYPGHVAIADVQRYAAENGLQTWPAKDAYQGIVSKKGPPNFRGTIVIFHGNAGPAIYRKYYFDALETRGYRVVLAEYPGYGGRPGELSEKNFVADGRRTALQAKEEFGGPLYLWGESLGCGVAAALSTDTQLRPRGIVMLTPWDSLLNEAKAKFPLLPVKLFLRDTYDNVANLADYKGPVAVIMSKQDEIVPNVLTERLYEALSRPKRVWKFENAGHNDWPSDPELEWWSEVMDFLNSEK
ncbi:MAG: Alpha/beta hydrolase family protein [Syntrophorhabdus sp. PtaU1.Bin153]|nr:MAG: Alpha/beta hydrolase family protein [Syntrophorhabdus sp. PtaU1.Bin153]